VRLSPLGAVLNRVRSDPRGLAARTVKSKFPPWPKRGGLRARWECIEVELTHLAGNELLSTNGRKPIPTDLRSAFPPQVLRQATPLPGSLTTVGKSDACARVFNYAHGPMDPRPSASCPAAHPLLVPPRLCPDSPGYAGVISGNLSRFARLRRIVWIG